MKDNIIFRITRITQFFFGLYMFFLVAMTIIDGIEIGTGMSQIIDWELRNRLIMGIVFIIPFMRLKREYQAIYIVILFLLVSIFITSMLFLPGRPDLYPIAIIITSIVYINIYFVARHRISSIKPKK